MLGPHVPLRDSTKLALSSPTLRSHLVGLSPRKELAPHSPLGRDEDDAGEELDGSTETRTSRGSRLRSGPANLLLAGLEKSPGANQSPPRRSGKYPELVFRWLFVYLAMEYWKRKSARVNLSMPL
jgi:hypothetical protein